MTAHSGDELARLRAENARLAGLLEAHGIAWRVPEAAAAPAAMMALTIDEKVALFRRLFRGRTDVYPVRWESKAGKTGYSPACANEWRVGVCEKPRIKCSDCGHRLLMPLVDQTIYDHLAGRHTVGVYPLLADDDCHLLAVDFDDADWRSDAQAFIQSCRELGVPAALEISRSGNGAHAWVFFSSKVAARDARRLGTSLISHTCARTRQLKLSSYDRLFPDQDTNKAEDLGACASTAARSNGCRGSYRTTSRRGFCTPPALLFRLPQRPASPYSYTAPKGPRHTVAHRADGRRRDDHPLQIRTTARESP